MDAHGRSSGGGVETQVALLAPLLARRGWRVAVAAHETGNLPSEFDGVRILPFRRPCADRAGARRLASYVGRFAKLAAGVDSRIFVQSSAGAETGLVALWAKARRRRFVYWSSAIMDFHFSSFASSRPVAAAFALGVRLADTVVLQTEEQVGLSRERFGRSGPVIRYLAEHAERRSAAPQRFIWVGRLAPYKNPLAFVRLARSMPEAEFLMVANPSPLGAELQREVELAARELANLTYVPGLAREELLPMFHDALALVSTSDHEGMPNVFLEAWARGVPVLAFACDPDGLIVRHHLGGYADGSFERLLSLARTMWRERDHGERLTSNCRDYVQKAHSPDAILPRWERALGLLS